MKQFLVILAILTGGLSQAYGQLPYPEMKLTASSGELHGYARAKANWGNSYVLPATYDEDWDDITLLPMTDSDVNKVYYNLNIDAAKAYPSTGSVASSNTYANAIFNCTEIGTSFSYDPFIQITGEKYGYTWVSAIFSGVLSRSEIKTWTGGKYSMTAVPNNWGSAQEVPANIIIDGFSLETNPGGGVTPYRESGFTLKVKWGNSYVTAVYNRHLATWAVTEYIRGQWFGSNYSYVTNIWYTDDEWLDLDILTTENVATNGSIVGEVIASASPTITGYNNPNNTTGFHFIDQAVQNYFGTGSGAGGMGTYYSGTVKLVPWIKLKKQ